MTLYIRMNTSLTSSETADLPAAGQTWSIAEVERETGLGKDTLRVWERRYGFPVPMRDKLGERAYPDEQVQRLRLLKRLLDAGHRPGKVVALPLEQLQGMLQAAPVATAGRISAGADPLHPELEDAQDWVQWLSSDRTDMVRQTLQQQIVREGLGHVIDRLVAPLCALVGQAWMRGEVSVYQEHLFTETLQSVLREAIASVDASGQTLQQSPRVLLTTTPGEQHGLGLLMAECHFALESCTRFVLGTSTPIVDIVLAARQLRIEVLALSYSAYASRRDLIESLQQLRDRLPAELQIWVGGAAAAQHARALPKGVVLMRRPADVSLQVRAWRHQHAPAA